MQCADCIIKRDHSHILTSLLRLHAIPPDGILGAVIGIVVVALVWAAVRGIREYRYPND